MAAAAAKVRLRATAASWELTKRTWRTTTGRARHRPHPTLLIVSRASTTAVRWRPAAQRTSPSRQKTRRSSAGRPRAARISRACTTCTGAAVACAWPSASPQEDQDEPPRPRSLRWRRRWLRRAMRSRRHCLTGRGAKLLLLGVVAAAAMPAVSTASCARHPRSRRRSRRP